MIILDIVGLGLIALLGIVVIVIGTATRSYAAQVVGLIVLSAAALVLLGIEGVLLLLTEVIP